MLSIYKKNIFNLIIVIFLTIACENSYNFQNNANLDIVVIQGILTHEYKYQTISLSKMLNTPYDTVVYITDATVFVQSKNNTYTFVHNPQKQGEYISTEKFIATVDNFYYLTVKYKEKQFNAATYVQPVAPFDNIKFAYNSQNNLFYIDYVAEVFDPFQSAMYQIEIDWSNTINDSINNTQTKALTYFFTLKTVDINQIFSPPSQQIYFPESTNVTVKKYSLTPEFEAYIRSMLYETQWAGSLFDVQHGFISTNIQGGAIGFFTASSVYKKESMVR